MARTYMKPPLIEAVCDFKFSSLQPWDWTIPGLFYEEIRDSFPYKEQLNTIETKIDQDQGQFIQQSIPKLQFSNEARNVVIQIAPDSLSIHLLPPYNSWIDFKEHIFEYLHAYQKAAHPSGLISVALRYINHVEIPLNEAELEEYFSVLPQVPAPIPQIFPSFLLNVDIPYTSPSSALRITFGTIIPKLENSSAYVLDLNMYSLSDAIPSDAHIIDWLEAAHEHIEEAFTASFTEKTHSEIFGEVNK
ncbi:TIGR04255 family protein [Ktedonobacteria bacterium brp13]|nr:TIGR04255 family protein [Ktedonobacteria bacterium brp13]